MSPLCLLYNQLWAWPIKPSCDRVINLVKYYLMLEALHNILPRLEDDRMTVFSSPQYKNKGDARYQA